MRSVKAMLLGIGLILVGIFFRLWSIGYGYSELSSITCPSRQWRPA